MYVYIFVCVLGACGIYILLILVLVAIEKDPIFHAGLVFFLGLVSSAEFALLAYCITLLGLRSRDHPSVYLMEPQALLPFL